MQFAKRIRNVFQKTNRVTHAYIRQHIKELEWSIAKNELEIV